MLVVISLSSRSISALLCPALFFGVCVGVGTVEGRMGMLISMYWFY